MDVADLLAAFAGFLRENVGGSPILAALGESAVDLAMSTLPDSLPLGTGHGDFVASNIFVGPSGRPTVFDPLLLWRVPCYQDLSTLIVACRAHPHQAATQGLALASRDLERYERAVLEGYFGSDPIPMDAIHLFQLLALLDMWSAQVSKRRRNGRLKPYLREARVHVANWHFEREARRLHSLLSV